jgi:hypothetical protein
MALGRFPAIPGEIRIIISTNFPRPSLSTESLFAQPVFTARQVLLSEDIERLGLEGLMVFLTKGIVRLSDPSSVSRRPIRKCEKASA